jgi:hypothetical protein
MRNTLCEAVKTTTNEAILKRFRVILTAPELHGHYRVPMILFRDTPLSDDEYAELLYPLDASDLYLRSVVDETFNAQEVEVLRNAFAEGKPEWIFETKPATPIAENQVGVGALAVGGGTDFLYWIENGKKIPHDLPVMAYYDLRQVESGHASVEILPCTNQAAEV